MVELPIATPPIKPEAASIVAAAVLLLLQLPPIVASLSVVVAASQTVELPEIAGNQGKVCIVTDVLA